ncbi:hypothetical protein DXV76_09590 [Rhodobacteraceae bacterium CCMM004]|nr:hypothetical protein DXV76_09590 [Rhodobacteraceae bacterium CCMM004]
MIRGRLAAAALSAVLAAAPAAAHGDRPWGDGHHHGGWPGTPQAHLVVYTPKGGFTVLVTPNLVGYERALAAAAPVAAGFCASRPGDGPAVVTDIDRYSELRLAAWAFSGHCD